MPRINPRAYFQGFSNGRNLASAIEEAYIQEGYISELYGI